MKQFCLVAAFLSASVLPAPAADEAPFSGPQVGEVLPSFVINSLLGESAGSEVDLIKQADGKPVALIFVNGRTRPGFGLTNLVMKFAASRAKEGLHSGVVLLTSDPTESEQWVRNVKDHFEKDNVTYGVSREGQEGPGPYGLNRNVELTILVGTEGKVTANFALVQPSVEADGPKIIKAIAEVTGGGEIPTVAQLGGDGYGDRAKMMRPAEGDDPAMRGLMSAVIKRNATPEQVQKAVEKVEAHIAKHENARKQLGRIATTIVTSGKIENYGTAPAQEAIRKWAKEIGPPKDEKKEETKPQK